MSDRALCTPLLLPASVLPGTLAGSTILLLSLAWGCSVILGRCDINARGLAQDKTLTRGWDLFNTGVTVDRDVGQGAAIMAASVLLYGIVQVRHSQWGWCSAERGGLGKCCSLSTHNNNGDGGAGARGHVLSHQSCCCTTTMTPLYVAVAHTHVPAGTSLLRSVRLAPGEAVTMLLLCCSPDGYFISTSGSLLQEMRSGLYKTTVFLLCCSAHPQWPL